MPDVVIVSETPAATSTSPPATTTEPSSNSSTEIPAMELGKVIAKVEALETKVTTLEGATANAESMARAALDRPATIIETPKEPEPESEAALVPVTLEPETPAAPPAKKRNLFARLFLD